MAGKIPDGLRVEHELLAYGETDEAGSPNQSASSQALVAVAGTRQQAVVWSICSSWQQPSPRSPHSVGIESLCERGERGEEGLGEEGRTEAAVDVEGEGEAAAVDAPKRDSSSIPPPPLLSYATGLVGDPWKWGGLRGRGGGRAPGREERGRLAEEGGGGSTVGMGRLASVARAVWRPPQPSMAGWVDEEHCTLWPPGVALRLCVAATGPCRPPQHLQPAKRAPMTNSLACPQAHLAAAVVAVATAEGHRPCAVAEGGRMTSMTVCCWRRGGSLRPLCGSIQVKC